MGNAVRASNLINMNMKEFNEAAPESEYNAICLKSMNYKTSLLYGEKMILLPNDLHKIMKFFIKHLRPLFIDDEKEPPHKRFLFTSSRGQKTHITHSNISQSLTITFRKAGVFNKETYVDFTSH